jgi:NADH-quinone oxidoreductase subunit N
MKDYTFDGFNGLAKTQPVLALATTICLLSLAGIPLTAGFFAKYYMLAAVVKTGSSLGWYNSCFVCSSKRVLLFPRYPGHVFQRRRSGS